MDTNRVHRSETFSFFPRDIRGFKFGRAHKTRSSTFDGRATAQPTPVPSSSTHTPVLSRLPASVQHLPPEIVLNILSFALPSLYETAAGFRHHPDAFFDEVAATHNFRHVLTSTQKTLRNAALISRAWYPVAVEFLYGCSFLDNPRSATVLSRTLESAPRLRPLVKEAWMFNKDGPQVSDPLGTKRKSARRVQANFASTLRTYTSLRHLTVCNHGLLSHGTTSDGFPLDNIIVYGLPNPPTHSHIPSLTLYGPSFFNQPFDRHPKPSNLNPEQLTTLCLRDIGPSPARLKCAPHLPTLPYVHTLQIALRTHDDAPIVSSGTLPLLRTLEVYRDIHDAAPAAGTRTVAVDETVLGRLARLVFVGRALESALFRRWAEAQLFGALRDVAFGPVHPDDLAFAPAWRFPDALETLTVVLLHRGTEPVRRGQELEQGDACRVLEALHACVHRNRQTRAFKKLVVRSVTALPRYVTRVAEELGEKCGAHGFGFELHEDAEQWIAENLSGENEHVV
ncbi:hypothetical protein PHLGIDRAFT_128396 [Phlebiopsis gigantea 11061_1 CR5-6]|uniref:Uncharacterized protein n=1 Tax=Phlebiopsis gigantea (strain 11061_1 CR5-6) TaxID=745531 RepID=A0A0C3NMI6_PHLG1|nr:hypothetical protein PHLGIDRAFT_128396 [Phlebiopsis gigantea 11061_1 CR5-6]